MGLISPLLSLGLGLNILADKYRECCLKLQKLLDNPCDNLSQKYSEALDFFPNHTPNDYVDFVIRHTWIETKILTDHLGNPVLGTKKMLLIWGGG